MYRIESETSGLRGLADEIVAETLEEAEHLVADGAAELSNTVKRVLTGRRSGAERPVPEADRTYVASAPGEPPAVMFGHLRNSVGWSRPEQAGDAVESRVGAALGIPVTEDADRRAQSVAEAYARILEVGGWAGHAYIDPRPYMAPAVDIAEPVIDRMWRR